MRTLSNLDFLELWERGSRLHPLDRALLALEATLPHEPDDVLADWPLGKRNAALVRFRGACFGQTLEGWVSCPQCDERLEFALDTEAFADNSGSEADANHHRWPHLSPAHQPGPRQYRKRTTIHIPQPFGYCNNAASTDGEFVR